MIESPIVTCFGLSHSLLLFFEMMKISYFEQSHHTTL